MPHCCSTITVIARDCVFHRWFTLVPCLYSERPSQIDCSARFGPTERVGMSTVVGAAGMDAADQPADISVTTEYTVAADRHHTTKLLLSVRKATHMPVQ